MSSLKAGGSPRRAHAITIEESLVDRILELEVAIRKAQVYLCDLPDQQNDSALGALCRALPIGEDAWGVSLERIGKEALAADEELGNVARELDRVPGGKP